MLANSFFIVIELIVSKKEIKMIKTNYFYKNKQLDVREILRCELCQFE